MAYDNERGEIFTDEGEKIFPTGSSEKINGIILGIWNGHPEDHCDKGGSIHRMLKIISFRDFDLGVSHKEYGCYDCGKIVIIQTQEGKNRVEKNKIQP